MPQAKKIDVKILFLEGNGNNFAPQAKIFKDTNVISRGKCGQLPQAKFFKDKHVISKGKWGQFCAAGENIGKVELAKLDNSTKKRYIFYKI